MGGLGETVEADLFEVSGREDRGRSGEVFESGREGGLEVDADGLGVHHLRRLHPVHILLRHRARLGRQHVVEGEGHVLGAEDIAVMEGHALAQGQFEGRRVDPFPGGGQHRLIRAGLRVAVEQGVPDVAGEHDALAGAVVIRAHVFRLGIRGIDQGIVGLAGQRRNAERPQQESERGACRGNMSGHDPHSFRYRLLGGP